MDEIELHMLAAMETAPSDLQSDVCQWGQILKCLPGGCSRGRKLLHFEPMDIRWVSCLIRANTCRHYGQWDRGVTTSGIKLHAITHSAAIAAMLCNRTVPLMRTGLHPHLSVGRDAAARSHLHGVLTAVTVTLAAGAVRRACICG